MDKVKLTMANCRPHEAYLAFNISMCVCFGYCENYYCDDVEAEVGNLFPVYQNKMEHVIIKFKHIAAGNMEIRWEATIVKALRQLASTTLLDEFNVMQFIMDLQTNSHRF